ncbi:unnamed protein product [Cunninghamella blakesleeana]
MYVCSLLGFGCHLLQCILLIQYQKLANIPNWIQAGHWQYLTWYVVLGLSLLSGLAIIIQAVFIKKDEKLRMDKIVSVLNVLPLATSIVTAVVFVNDEPWSNFVVNIKRPMITGLVHTCYQFNSNVDRFYPLLYQRCLLSDSTWIGSVIICFFWTLLFVTVMTMQPLSQKNYTLPRKEPDWGRYIPDPIEEQYQDQQNKKKYSESTIGSQVMNSISNKFPPPAPPTIVSRRPSYLHFLQQQQLQHQQQYHNPYNEKLEINGSYQDPYYQPYSPPPIILSNNINHPNVEENYQNIPYNHS